MCYALSTEYWVLGTEIRLMPNEKRRAEARRDFSKMQIAYRQATNRRLLPSCWLWQ